MSRKKFATQVDTAILSAVRTLAREEGRQLQALVDEALSDPVEKHHRARPRDRVPMSWAHTTPAMKNSAVSARSSLNERLAIAEHKSNMNTLFRISDESRAFRRPWGKA
jgi:hypothetical protein